AAPTLERRGVDGRHDGGDREAAVAREALDEGLGVAERLAASAGGDVRHRGPHITIRHGVSILASPASRTVPPRKSTASMSAVQDPLVASSATRAASR